jgi:hypothetical protein
MTKRIILARMRSKKRFDSLGLQLYNRLECKMAPQHVGPRGPVVYRLRGGLRWRNGLARKMWRRPGRYTSAGSQTLVSQMARLADLWPWQVRTMTFEELIEIIEKIQSPTAVS